MAQRTVDAKLALLRQHDEDGVPWTRIAATAGVPARTLSRWARQYRTHSTSGGLERRPRSDKGQQRTPQEITEAIQALALRRPEPTVAFIHRRVSGLAQDRGVPAPSYSTVRAVIAAIDPGLRTLAQHGEAAYHGFLTGLRAPNLDTAVVDMQELSSAVPLAAALRHLSLMCERIDFSHVFHEATRLESLAVYGCRRVDLRAVPLPVGLRELLIADCQLLKGTERLNELSHLNQLKLIRVSRIEAAQLLLDVRAEKADIVNCPDIGVEFVREAKERHPSWWVEPSRRAVSRSRFDVQPLEEGGYQVMFDDWEWVRSLLPWDQAMDFGSGEMEQALSRVAHDPKTRPVTYTFDSEGDTLIAIVPTKTAAARLRKMWDRAASDAQSFAAICSSVV